MDRRAIVAISLTGGSMLALAFWRCRRQRSTLSDKVCLAIGPSTKFILSTSGRRQSAERYRVLLQEILKLDWAYIAFSSPTDKIESKHFAWALRGLNAVGGAISKDIKGTIAKELDEVDQLALDVGAVNTVVRRGSRLIGYNTDAIGFKVAIQNGLRGLSVTSAVCYGYGGVTSVVVAVLRRLNISVCITGRRLEAAKLRADELGVGVFRPGDAPVQLFVNAAPVTDMPLDQAPNFIAALQGCSVCFDHELQGIYLHEHCKVHGLRHIPGKDMYYPQMEAQWSLFLEGTVPSKEVPALLEEAQRRAVSISQ